MKYIIDTDYYIYIIYIMSDHENIFVRLRTSRSNDSNKVYYQTIFYNNVKTLNIDEAEILSISSLTEQYVISSMISDDQGFIGEKFKSSLRKIKLKGNTDAGKSFTKIISRRHFARKDKYF